MTSEKTQLDGNKRQQLDIEGRAALPVQPLQFIKFTDYTTFSAELAITEGDLVYHFYVTAEVNALPDARVYWYEVFAQVLERVAQEYFKATAPRLKAAYTQEQASWWLRAFGFGMVLDPHKLAYGFLHVLDAALDLEMEKLTNPG